MDVLASSEVGNDHTPYSHFWENSMNDLNPSDNLLFSPVRQEVYFCVFADFGINVVRFCDECRQLVKRKNCLIVENV